MRKETLKSICIPFCFNALYSFVLVSSTIDLKAYAIYSFLVYDNKLSDIIAVYLIVN